MMVGAAAAEAMMIDAVAAMAAMAVMMVTLAGGPCSGTWWSKLSRGGLRADLIENCPRSMRLPSHLCHSSRPRARHSSSGAMDGDSDVRSRTTTMIDAVAAMTMVMVMVTLAGGLRGGEWWSKLSR